MNDTLYLYLLHIYHDEKGFISLKIYGYRLI